MKIGAISLGCDKNRVDTENILYFLGRGGYALTDDMNEADVIIINTCAFIKSAEKEAVDEIFAAAECKKTGKCKKLVVAGCLPMKFYSHPYDTTFWRRVGVVLGKDMKKVYKILHPATAPALGNRGDL